MKRSSASITLVLIGSVVGLPGCDRPRPQAELAAASGQALGAAPGQALVTDSDTTDTRRRNRYYRSGYGPGYVHSSGSRSVTGTNYASGSGSVSTTSRGGFGSSVKGFFGG